MDIAETSGGYSLTWRECGVIISIDRLHSHHDGRLTGEATVFYQNGTGKPIKIYPATSVNFLADRTRSGLVKSLSMKVPEAPWRDIIDQLCDRVLALTRQGAPLEQIIGVDDGTPPSFLISPFVVENYPNVLFGDPGSFKSNLALVLAGIIALPWSNNPLHLSSPAEPIPTAYLDWETDKASVNWSQCRLSRGEWGMPSFPLFYRPCAAPLAQDLTSLKVLLDEQHIRFAIIDSLTLAAGGELNSSESATSFYAALRQLKITSLILAHNSKDREASKRTIIGHQTFTAQARNVWEIRTENNEDSDQADIVLYHQKAPPWGKRHGRLAYHVAFTKESISISRTDAKAMSSFDECDSVPYRITEFLKREGRSTPAEIARALGIKPNQIYNALHRLKSQQKVGDWGGQYGVLS